MYFATDAPSLEHPAIALLQFLHRQIVEIGERIRLDPYPRSTGVVVGLVFALKDFSFSEKASLIDGKRRSDGG
jgi:hypothetical protein